MNSLVPLNVAAGIKQAYSPNEVVQPALSFQGWVVMCTEAECAFELLL
jgi:hypothetical protein